MAGVMSFVRSSAGLLCRVCVRPVVSLALVTSLHAAVLSLAERVDGCHTTPCRIDQRFGLRARHLPGGVALLGEIPTAALHDPAQLSGQGGQQIGALAEIHAFGALHEVVEQDASVLPRLILEVITVRHVNNGTPSRWCLAELDALL
jgi:hypothetical protein